MEQELTSPLIFRVKKARAHSRDKRTSFEIPRRQSIRIKESQIESQGQQLSLLSTSQVLQWQKSDIIQTSVQTNPKQTKRQKKSKAPANEWFGAQQNQKKQQRLNQMFLHLTPKVQKILYILNFILNAAIRIMFINLLAFLGIINKWIYLKAFLSLYLITVFMYLTIMVKMLFTKEDTESVYFQKVFNQIQWSDIQSQRLMGAHFNFCKIISKITVFFNPFTKFQKNIKISFLKQQIFKRIELIVVIIPFSCVFFIRPYDFIREDQPNFNLYITWAICIQSLKTASTYLIVYLYS